MNETFLQRLNGVGCFKSFPIMLISHHHQSIINVVPRDPRLFFRTIPIPVNQELQATSMLPDIQDLSHRVGWSGNHKGGRWGVGYWDWIWFGDRLQQRQEGRVYFERRRMLETYGRRVHNPVHPNRLNELWSQLPGVQPKGKILWGQPILLTGMTGRSWGPVPICRPLSL